MQSTPDRLCREIEARAAHGVRDVDGVAKRAQTLFGTSAALGAVALQRAFWDITEAAANDPSGACPALELLVVRAMAERDRFVAQFSPHHQDAGGGGGGDSPPPASRSDDARAKEELSSRDTSSTSLSLAGQTSRDTSSTSLSLAGQNGDEAGGGDDAAHPALLPCIDRSVLLDAYAPEQWTSFVTLFVDDLNKARNDIDALLADGDRAGVRQEAHNIAGSAAALGAVALVSAYEALEHAAETDDMELQPLIAQTKAEGARFLSDFYGF